MALIGNSFSEYVSKQILVRQKALGQGYTDGRGEIRKISTLNAFNSSTAWMRLASAVKITEGDTTLPGMSVADQIRSNGLLDGLRQSDWLGQGLAKNLILRGSPTDSNGTGVAGVNSNPIEGSNFFEKAYGWGYNVSGINYGQGLVPPPGVTNVDFKYDSDGALARATITIKAFSAEQFALIDILYMRPGYTCLLEFGHSMYLNNDNGEIVNLDTSQTAPLSYLFQDKETQKTTPTSYTEMAKKISNEKEKHDGNYEGFFGKVVKWNWKFNTDGSYDITVNLTGTGDVISSLKANVPKLTSTPTSFKSDFDFSKTESTLAQTISNGLVDGFNSTGEFLGFDGNIINTSKEDAAEEGAFIISNAQSSQLNFELYALWADQKKFNHTDKGLFFKSNYNGIAYDLPFINIPISSEETPREFKMDGGLVKFDVRAGIDPKYSPTTLIKFGGFLTMLQKICNVTDGKRNFLLQFEMVEHISRPNQTPDNPSSIPDNTFIVTYPGNFSSDPNVCLIKSTQLENTSVWGNEVKFNAKRENSIGLNINSLINKTLTKSPNYKTDHLVNPKFAYPLSEVYINLNFISTVLENLKGSDDEADNNENINVLDLLKGILNGVNTSLGGLNDFRVIFNEDTSQIDIISESPILSVKDTKSQRKVKNQPRNYTTINTFGFEKINQINEGSFVTSLNLNSELTNQYATQISIGAQNNSNTINGSGTSFSTYNKGLVDNLFVEKQSTLEVKEPQTDEEKDLEYERLFGPTKIAKVWRESKVNEALDEVYNNGNFDEEEYVSILRQINTSISPLVIAKYNQTHQSPTPTFLPFNMSLEMHGLGGLKIYEAFKINGKGLPLSYNENQIKLIIKSLSHSVSLEGWKTKISTFTVPIFFAKDKKESTAIRESNNKKKSCEDLKDEQYSATLGGTYPILETYTYSGADPRAGLTFQGKGLDSIEKLMISSDGVKMPAAANGVSRKLFEALQIIGDACTSANLTSLTINSHYRSPYFNCTTGGQSNSMHKTGGAIDIGTSNPTQLKNIILELISKNKIPEGGVGLYNSFVHYDIRGTNARWVT